MEYRVKLNDDLERSRSILNRLNTVFATGL